MSPYELLPEASSQRMAVALLHFAWQGTLVAAIYRVLVEWFIHTAERRYRAGVAALITMAACLPVTYWLVQTPNRGPTDDRASMSRTVAPSGDRPAADLGSFSDQLAVGELRVELAAATQATPSQPASNSNSIDANANRPKPWRDEFYREIVLVWLLGVSLFSLRLVRGAVAVQLLTRRVSTAGVEHSRLLERLGRTMRLSRLPRLAVSAYVAEAIATGFFRPIIVFPTAWLSELPPSVIEAVLAHELAHIRRCDVWVNLLQRTVEAVLFFHPAVWWLSRQVRSEREMCCDELAVAATGEKVAYVSALEVVARRAAREPVFSLASGIGGRKMQLLERVRHILGLPAQRQPGGWWAAGVLALAAPCGVWALSGPAAPLAFGQEERREGDRPREERREGERREGDRPREERRERRDEDRERAERRDRQERDRDERRADEERERDERGERDRGDRAQSEEARRDRERRDDFKGQRRRSDDQQNEARAQQQEARRAVERAQEAMQRRMQEVQQKLSDEMRRAAERGEGDKVEALHRELEKMQQKMQEEARNMERKLENAMRDMGRRPERRAIDEERRAELQQMMQKIEREFAERRHELEERLQGARKEGDKPLMQKLQAEMQRLEAETAVDREKLIRSLAERQEAFASKARTADRPDAMNPQREMMQAIKELRNEVQQLRREVNELRAGSPRKERPKDGDRPKGAKADLGDLPYVGKLFRKDEQPENDGNKPNVSIEFEGKKRDADKLDLKVKPRPKLSIGFSQDGSALVGEITLDNKRGKDQGQGFNDKEKELYTEEIKKAEIEFNKAAEQLKNLDIDLKNAANEKLNDAEIKIKKAPIEKLKDTDVKVKKAPHDKLKDVEIEFKNNPIEKLKDVENEFKTVPAETLNDIQLELNSSALEELKNAEHQLKGRLATLKQDDIKRLKDQLASDIEVRYAAKAAEVAKNELDRAIAANRNVPNVVSSLDIEKLKLAHEKALLEIERAKRVQLDRLVKLKKELENQPDKSADIPKDKAGEQTKP